MHKTELEEPIVVRAAQGLRRDIINGRFESGQKLKIQNLQNMYGYSSTPLREALTQLSKEGLIDSDARRGFRVTKATREDFADITRMRLLIDIEALKDSVTLGDDNWEAHVVASFYRLEKVEARLGGGPEVLNEEWSQLHKAFHASLISSCSSPRMLNYSSILFDQAERYRRISARRRQGPRRKTDEHKAIMDAALAREIDQASELLYAHIEKTKRNVIETLDSMPAAMQA